MLHILFLTHWYPSTRKPVEGIFIQEHARAISSKHLVSVFHITGIDQTSANLASLDPTHNITTYQVAYPKPKIPKTAWLQRVKNAETLFIQLRSGHQPPPDLIHAQVYSSADLALYLGRKYRLPVVLSEHASSYPRNLFSRIQAVKVRLILNQMNLIMPVCETLRGHMERYGIRGPFEVVPNAVDTQVFFPTQSRPRRDPRNYQILQVATLNQNKSVHDFIRALPKIRQVIGNIKAVIIGEGPERSNLEDMAQQLGMSEQIFFTGFQTKPQVADWMRHSDCLVLTSKWENQPVAILEALACGLPVVATRVGGVPEIINEHNGVLVAPENPDELVRGIYQVLSSSGRYLADEISGRAVEKYGYSAIAERFDQCYQRVLAGRYP
jgi:L-malate glycosyltransferase